MALLQFDGFESGIDEYNGWLLTEPAGEYRFGTSYGRYGGRGCSMGYYFGYPALYQNYTATDATAYIGFAFNCREFDDFNGGTICWVKGAGTSSRVRLTMNTAGTLTIQAADAWFGGSATTLDTSDVGVIQLYNWHYIEFKAYIHDTSGIVEVKVDGAVRATFSGDTDYAGGTAGSYDQMGVGNASWGAESWCDDVYFCDSTGSVNNDYLGDVRCELLVPDGNGTTNEFVGSDADSTDNYLLVDEGGAISTADYVESSTVGDRDLYTMSNMSLTGYTIVAARLSTWAEKDDANGRGIKTVLKSGATTDVSADNALSEAWQGFAKTYLTDPNTGAAWTETNLNAIEAGVEVGS